MLFVVGNRLLQVRFDSEKLSPEQWARITELTGLPAKAKAELEDYIGFYRALRSDARQHYGNVSERVEKVRKWEATALRGLTKLMASKDFFPAIAMGVEYQVNIFDEELELIREWLKQTCEQKRKLLDWYGKALTRLRRSNRVPSSLFNLIRLLNTLLYRYTGERISSGKKNPAFSYVLEVCNIAEPQLRTKKGKGINTVHEVTKRVVTQIISDMPGIEIEGWGHLIPYWVPTKDVFVRDPARKIKIELYEAPGGRFVENVKLPRIEGEGMLCILAPLFAPKTQQ